VTEVVQQVVNALSLGSTYALLALGLAMVLAILGMVNFAHGELLTLGAYAMYGAYKLGLPFGVQVVVALAAAGAAGVAMERVAFRPLRGAGFATLLFASFALSVVIQNSLRAFVSPRQLALPVPSFFDDVIHVGGATIGWLQIITMASTALALIGLSIFLRRTTQGLGMLAAAQDFQIARLVGVPANRVIATAFGISGLLAGLASIFDVARVGTVSPSMGFQPVIAALIGTVIGGVGSLTGAVVGGFIYGALQVAFDAALPTGLASYAPAFSLALVIAILYFRPQGILQQAAEER